jgi:hypothetical protein
MQPARQRLRIAALVGIGLAIGSVSWVVIQAFVTEVSPHPAPPVPAVTSRESRPKAEDILAKLRPGMLRADVEAILGPAKSVDSIRSGDGRLSYRATFASNPMHPPLPPLELEFDATRPGHPLIIVKPM